MTSLSEYLRDLADKIDGDANYRNVQYLAIGAVMDGRAPSDFFFHDDGPVAREASMGWYISELAANGAMLRFVTMQKLRALHGRS